jgi:iron complex outermembrane receptor protein
MIAHCGFRRASWFATSALASSILLAPLSVQAADAPPAPASAAASAAVSEVVVTARGRVERLQDVPVSASVLSGLEIQRAGNSFADISTMIPSLRISRGGAGTG